MVTTASPARQRTPIEAGPTSGSASLAALSALPPRSETAASTPPPPTHCLLAALTIASPQKSTTEPELTTSWPPLGSWKATTSATPSGPTSIARLAPSAGASLGALVAADRTGARGAGGAIVVVPTVALVIVFRGVTEDVVLRAIVEDVVLRGGGASEARGAGRGFGAAPPKDE